MPMGAVAQFGMDRGGVSIELEVDRSDRGVCRQAKMRWDDGVGEALDVLVGVVAHGGDY